VNFSLPGKERDADTGLDYFEARYFSSAQGRFTTPDEPLMDQDVNDPQSWNLYGYVRNNPLRFTDPTGQACVSNGSGGWKDDDSGGQSCADVDKANREKKPDVTVTDNAEPITWSQYFGFDRAYNRAVEQQVQIDVNAGRWDRVPVLRGEIPVGPPGAAGRFLFQSWNRATFANRLQSLLYHWRKHGRAAGKTFEQYAQDGVAFFNQNKSMATQVTLKDGTPGLLIRLGKGQPGGYFKPSGEVVTFWYK
jgi:RHS repeat-associated protein